MRLDGIKCPYCGKENTHAYQVEKVNIWDDSTYGCFKELCGSQLKFTTCDNVIYRCKCNDCEKYFSSMVEMEISVKNVMSMESASNLMCLECK